MDNVIIDVDDVKKRLNSLNVYKSYGPDMLHQRILKELQNEIAICFTIKINLWMLTEN